jgi:flagellar hook assembly protein FlgD
VVRELARGPFGAGRHSLVWDGRDSRGNTASPGIYFVQGRAGNRDFRLKMVFVR